MILLEVNGPQFRRKTYKMSNPDQMYDEAIALKDKGNLPGAVEKLLEIEALAPTHTLTHSALAIMLQKLGKYDEAIAHAKKVVELNPTDSFSQSQLSVIYQRCGRIPEAEDALARSRTMHAGGGCGSGGCGHH
jgi:Flp pilus assembly protein TadD